MIRRLACIVSAVAVLGLVGGCDKGPVSTNPDNIPVKASDGTDKKGRPTKTFEAGLEDPNQQRK